MAEDDLGSEFGYDSEIEKNKKRRLDLATKEPAEKKSKAGKDFLQEEQRKEHSRQQRLLQLDAYSRHKQLINEYFLYYPGSTKDILKRDGSKDKTDLDVIRANHKFLWEDEPTSWEKKLAKKYYDKLFKEYCITDLSRYKENKVALRWRTQQEVVDGKGQFVCGDKRCQQKENLASWEVNFGYLEDGTKKNALVKLRLCGDCSYRLNYHNKRKQVVKKKKHRRRRSSDSPETSKKSEETEQKDSHETEISDEKNEELSEEAKAEAAAKEKELWSKPADVEEDRSREDEFEDFLDDLLL